MVSIITKQVGSVKTHYEECGQCLVLLLQSRCGVLSLTKSWWSLLRLIKKMVGHVSNSKHDYIYNIYIYMYT